MPIVDVEIVSDGEIPAGLASQLADAVGAALGSTPGSTWVRLRRLPRTDYGESGGPLDPAIRPVFVTVVAGRDAEPETRAEESAQVAAAVAELTGHPSEHVHLIWEADARGRVAFGGRLVPPP